MPKKKDNEKERLRLAVSAFESAQARLEPFSDDELRAIIAVEGLVRQAEEQRFMAIEQKYRWAFSSIAHAAMPLLIDRELKQKADQTPSH